MVINQDILNMYVALEPGYEGSRIVRMGGRGVIIWGGVDTNGMIIVLFPASRKCGC